MARTFSMRAPHTRLRGLVAPAVALAGAVLFARSSAIAGPPNVALAAGTVVPPQVVRASSEEIEPGATPSNGDPTPPPSLDLPEVPITEPAATAPAPGAAPAPSATPAPSPVRPRHVPAFVPSRPAPPPIGPDAPSRLEVHGFPGAYFYRPDGHGRERVIVYLHGRGSDPAEHCQRLHQSVRAYGWLLCPIGPAPHGHGREWHNNRDYAARESIASLEALQTRFGARRVRRHDNVLMGFSEGAYVGMNVALMNPRTFPRWFIVAADDRYIDSEHERIARAQLSVARVYLLTGSEDVTLPHSRAAHTSLERAFGHLRERFRIVPGMPHQLPEDAHLLRNIFAWLSR